MANIVSSSQLNAIMAAIVNSASLFSQAPYLAPEAFVGDVVDYSSGIATGSLSSVSVLLNGISQGSSYTLITGDIGKTVQATQTSTLSGQTSGASSSVGTVTALPKFSDFNLLGGNLTSSLDYGRNPLFANAVFDGRGFGVQGSFAAGGISIDANGWPSQACETVLTEDNSQLPPGTYHCTITSTGNSCSVSLSGPGVVTITNRVVVNGTTSTFDLNYTSGTALLQFSTGFTSLDIPRDGSSTTVGKSKYNAAALAFYSKFAILRPMEFMKINLNTQVNFSDRTPNYPNIVASFLAADGSYYSWETFIDFFNAVAAYSGSKLQQLWVVIPGNTTPAYATSLSSLFNTYAPSGAIALSTLKYTLERGNEPWNSGVFPLYGNYKDLGAAEVKMLSNYGLSSTLISSAVGNGTQVTVTLSVNISTLPFTISVNQTILAADANTAGFQGNAPGGGLATPSAPALVSAVTTNTFSYPSSYVGSSISAFAVLFNVTSNLITFEATQLGACNVYNISPKVMVRGAYLSQQAWRVNRPNDRWVLNLQQYAGQVTAANTYAPIHFDYAAFLGGGNAASWLYGAATAPYVSPSSGGNYTSGTKTVTQCPIAAAFQVGDSLCLSQGGLNYASLNTTVTAVDGPNNTLTVNDTVLTSQPFGTVYMTGTRVAGAIAAMNLNLTGYTDGSIRGHVYQCRKYGLQPMAYECGPDIQAMPQAQVELLAAPAMQTFCTSLYDTWFKNGGQEMCLFTVTPGLPLDGPGSDAGGGLFLVQYWPGCLTFADITSPKVASIFNYATTRNYANIYGAPGTITPAYCQTQSQGTISSAGIAYWYTSTGRSIDFTASFPRARRWGLIVNGTDSAAGTTAQVWIDQVQVGTAVLGQGGDASNTNPTIIPSTAIPVTLTAGNHNISIRIPSGGNTPGIKSITFTKI